MVESKSIIHFVGEPCEAHAALHEAARNSVIELLVAARDALEVILALESDFARPELEAHFQDQLHVFVEASELRWCFECLDGNVKLTLIGGKTRLALLKPLKHYRTKPFSIIFILSSYLR